MKEHIRISESNPQYWEYDGELVLLLGGSQEDNLFQVPDVQLGLDKLQAATGNYVRCTMSSRDPGDVWPFALTDQALYDMEHPLEEYWRRFSEFLAATYERDIIVQIEIWATFDYYRENWANNPFNPKNNVNYTAEESKLPVEVDSHPVRTENPFFWSVPAEHNNDVILPFQRAFVDAILAQTLDYPHILYCMDNETSVTPEWAKYWATFIKERAAEKGAEVFVTEMWDAHDLSDEQHAHTFAHPELYDFVDISQNNHQRRQIHWDNMQAARARIHEAKVRPMNNVKIYGADTGRYGSADDGIDRFWRNVFGKMASARFHRPDSGIGWSDEALAQIKSARMLADAVGIFDAEPRNDLLDNRDADEAYLLINGEDRAAIFFPDGGEVVFNMDHMTGESTHVQWLDVQKGEWLTPQTVIRSGQLWLRAPLPAGRQAALIRTE